MKTLNKFFLLLLVAVVMMMSACHQYDTVDFQDQEPWVATHTIHQLLDEFLSQNGDYFPVRQNSGTIGLYSVDSIPTSGPDIIIRGRIVSEDVSGNVYKTLILQDEKEPSQGLKLSVDAGSLTALYQKGQLIAIRCNGLAIGKYANQPQLGVPYFNTDKEPDWQPGATGPKQGWEPGRIPLPIYQHAVQCIGQPDPSAIVVTDMKIKDIHAIVLPDKTNVAYMNVAKYCGLVVRVSGIYFNQKSQGSSTLLMPIPAIAVANNKYISQLTTKEKEGATIFAPPTDQSIGYPQSRDVQSVNSADGTWISISTSEYARFAAATIPSPIYSVLDSTTVVGRFEGTVVGMLNFYQDKASYVAAKDDWSISISSLDEITFTATESGLYRITQDSTLSTALQYIEKGATWKAQSVYYPKY